MSDALGILHGEFGRVALILVDKAMAVHAHRVCHVIFKVGGAPVDFGIREREHLPGAFPKPLQAVICSPTV
jgi:AraC family transcriptional regulator